MMMNRTVHQFVLFAAVSLASCTNDQSGSKTTGHKESCADIQKEQALFRQEMQQKAHDLQIGMLVEGNTPDLQAYPKLQDSEKLMNFQAEVQAGENKFAARLKECI